MRIEITKDYIVTADQYQFILKQKGWTKAKEGKPPRAVEKIIGYYPSFKQLVRGLADHDLRLSEFDKASQVLDRLEEIGDQLDQSRDEIKTILRQRRRRRQR